MVSSDDWTKCAMRDGEVVAELLVKLREAKVIKNPTVAALRWGIRQPRSRSPRKEAETRCSPSTPLSWSGGCGCGASSSSPSTYVDGYEATSRRRITSVVGSRSKVLVTTADLDFDVKRLQRKKDVALLRSPFSESKNLKSMKMDHSQNLVENENRKANGNFLLPDLNIMPCEDNCDQYSSLGVETALWDKDYKARLLKRVRATQELEKIKDLLEYKYLKEVSITLWGCFYKDHQQCVR